MKVMLNRALKASATSVFGVIVYRMIAVLYTELLLAGSYAKRQSLFPLAEELNLDLRTHIKYPENIRIGRHVIVGAACQIGAMAEVVIGDHVRISRGVTIETAGLDTTIPAPYRHVAKPIYISRGVWLGAHATVLGGVTIGEGAIIGAGAVVARDVPAGAVIVGASVRNLSRY